MQANDVVRLKKISGATERNGEPVEIELEDACPICTDIFVGGGECGTTAHVRPKYRSHQKEPLHCGRCGDTRAIINQNGINLLDLYAKYLGKV